MTIEAGKRFRLVRDFGNQAFDQVGGVRHGLAAGAVGTVVLAVAATEAGAHNDHEDAFVLEFEDESRTIGADGSLLVQPALRRVSFAVTDFDAANPDRLFEDAQ